MEQAFPVFIGMAEDVGGAESLLVEFERLFGAVDRQIRRDRLHGSSSALRFGFPSQFEGTKEWRDKDRVTGNVMVQPRTLYDKIWDDHMVDQQPDGTCLLYIDRHLVHEVTSPQAFEGLRLTGRQVRAPEKTLAVVDHNIPTTDRSLPNPDPESAEQIRVMAQNAHEFGIEYYNEFDTRQSIVHIIEQEQGYTQHCSTNVSSIRH